MGIKKYLELKHERILIYGDSQLIVNYILGIYQYHNELLKNYKYVALKLLKLFKSYKIDRDPRSSNLCVDTMASLGSLIPPNSHRHIQHVEIVTLK